MRIDSNFPTATASSTNDHRVRTPLQKLEPQDTENAGIQQRGAVRQVPATAGVSRTARPSDTARISGAAPSFSDLATAVHTAADVRHAKVESLRQALDEGTYQVSPQRIAESMLAQATSKLR